EWKSECIIYPSLILDHEVIVAFCAHLKKAKRPFFIFGSGSQVAGATDFARQLVELLGASCASTIGGKGVIDECSPLSLGASLGDERIDAVIKSADLVVVIGVGADNLDRCNREVNISQDLLLISCAPDIFVQSYQGPILSIACDAGLILREAVNDLKDMPVREPWQRDLPMLFANIRLDMRTECGRFCDYLDVIREELPSNGIIFHDMEYMEPNSLCSGRYFLAREPGCWISASEEEMPARDVLFVALGGYFAHTSRRMIALIRKPRVNCMWSVLATAVGYGWSFPLVILNNSLPWDLNPESWNQMLEIPLKVLKIKDIARLYGAKYRRVTSPRELSDALQSGFCEKVPTLIELFDC
ncbi:MAG: hypothetical protein PSN37_00045, partial [Alphaproteobacteria bacterium]|nr:hypothetical protein [Alphaproteobacteria bacterium]